MAHRRLNVKESCILYRIVAIKRLTAHSEGFEQEARAIAALNHPHICQIHDVGPDYLVLEYIEGQAIRGPLAAGEALRLAIQIAGALADTGDMGRAEGLIETLRPGHAYGAPIALATFHALCSEIDQAADWTERAIAERHPAVFFFLMTNGQVLRSSPRWTALASKLNLPDTLATES